MTQFLFKNIGVQLQLSHENIMLKEHMLPILFQKFLNSSRRKREHYFVRHRERADEMGGSHKFFGSVDQLLLIFCLV